MSPLVNRAGHFFAINLPPQSNPASKQVEQGPEANNQIHSFQIKQKNTASIVNQPNYPLLLPRGAIDRADDILISLEILTISESKVLPPGPNRNGFGTFLFGY